MTKKEKKAAELFESLTCSLDDSDIEILNELCDLEREIGAEQALSLKHLAF